MYQQEKGFTVVEVLVAVLIASFALVGVLGSIQASVTHSAVSRMQTYGTNLANKSLEKCRAMPFDDLGIQGGDPSGTLPASEQVQVQGRTFTISYQVSWVDSPVDQLAPNDTEPHDYKRVKVTVSWTSPFASSIKISTDVKKQNASPDVAFSEGYPQPTNADSEVIELEEGVLILKPTAAPTSEGGKYAKCYLRAEAVDSDGWIDWVRFWIGDLLVKEYNTSGNPQTYTTFPDYTWNTATYPEGGYWVDGSYVVRAEAMDNVTAKNYEDYEVILDNYRPLKPTGLMLDTTVPAPGQTDVLFSFYAGKDGDDDALAYKIYRNGTLVKVIDLREEEEDFEVTQFEDPDTGDITTSVTWRDANRLAGTYTYEVESISWIIRDENGQITREGWYSVAPRASKSITVP